jgi:hypothetical protein
MGTRAMTVVKETYQLNGKQKTKTVTSMYRQFDGYEEGHGLELAEFINSREFVNGMSGKKEVFNGVGCFAAQMICHFKEGKAGGFYLYPHDETGGCSYKYEVIVDFDKIEKMKKYTPILKVYECGYMTKNDKYVNKNKLIFSGTASKFIQKIKEKVEEPA